MAARSANDYICFEMQPLVARVKNGRLILDEPTDLPDGQEVHLVPVDEEDGDDLDDEERAALDREIDASLAEHDAGLVVDHEEVMAELLATRS